MDSAWKHWAEQWGNEEPDELEGYLDSLKEPEPMQLELPFPPEVPR